MRLRVLALWFIVPPVLVVVGACWFVERSVQSERARVAGLAGIALLGESLNLASASVTGETVILLALDAFTTRPPALELYEASAATMRVELDRPQLLIALTATETEGATALRDLSTLTTVDPNVREVLMPLDPDVRQRVAGGDRHLIEPGAYVDASIWLREQSDGAQTRATDAAAELSHRAQRRPYWRASSFTGFALALALVAIGGGLGAFVKFTASSRRVSGRVEVLQERTERLRTLIGLARRLSGESDTASLARALVCDVRSLVGGDVAVLLLRGGDALCPFVSDGDMSAAVVGVEHDSLIARCVNTGALTRRVVARDVAFPDEAGPLSVISAPLVVNGMVIGAIAAATRGTTPFHDNDDVVMQLVALIAAGALQSAQRHESTAALALHDPLTGLANRRRLEHDLAAVAGSNGEPVAFLMIDVDHFKRFNDQHGHVAGDQLLQRVAAAISAAVRESDVVYRYGGEEFSVLLPGTDAALAMVVAERVRHAVAKAAPPSGTEPVTVSIGIATGGPTTGGTTAGRATTLVEAADVALYRAKQSGRDRVMVA